MLLAVKEELARVQFLLRYALKPVELDTLLISLTNLCQASHKNAVHAGQELARLGHDAKRDKFCQVIQWAAGDSVVDDEGAVGKPTNEERDEENKLGDLVGARVAKPDVFQQNSRVHRPI